MDKSIISFDHFEELKHMMKNVMESNQESVKSNLKFQEERMNKTEDLLLHQQESIVNLKKKQVTHIVNYIVERAFTKMDIFRECNISNIFSFEVLKMSNSQDTNTYFLVQEKLRDESQEVDEENFSSKRVSKVIPYHGNVKHNKERVLLKNFIKMLTQIVHTSYDLILLEDNHSNEDSDVLQNNFLPYE